MADKQSRREFCGHACRTVPLLALAGALASALESCGGSSGSPTAGSSISSLPQLSATAGAAGLVLTIGASSPLAAAGSAAIVQYQGGLLLVARTSDTAFTALSAICTHQGCPITERTGQNYFCGCHGSQFDINGRVLVGPAVAPLPQHATQFDATSGTLTIAV